MLTPQIVSSHPRPGKCNRLLSFEAFTFMTLLGVSLAWVLGTVLTGRLARIDGIIIKYQTDIKWGGPGWDMWTQTIMQEVKNWVFINVDFAEICWFPNQHPFFIPKSWIFHPASLKLWAYLVKLPPSWALKVGWTSLRLSTNRPSIQAQ